MCVCCFCTIILLLQSIIIGGNVSGSRQQKHPNSNPPFTWACMAVRYYKFNPPLSVSECHKPFSALCSWLGVTVKILDTHTWFHGLHANGLPEVSDDSQSISVGESTHRSAVHLQQHIPAAGEPPGVTDQRLRNYVSEVGELSVLCAASDLNHRDQLPRSPPWHGALLHFGGPVLLLFQCFGHCLLLWETTETKSKCPLNSYSFSKTERRTKKSFHVNKLRLPAYVLLHSR